MRLKWLSLGVILATIVAIASLWAWRYKAQHRYDPLILEVGQRYGMSPGLIKTVVWQESRFNASARGKAGELGLMQVGADAANEWAAAEGVIPFSHEQCLNPKTNILAGSWYLRKALAKYKAVDDPLPYALAEYNAGRRNVLRWKTGQAETNSKAFMDCIGFPTTSNYVRRIMENRDRFRKQFKETPG